MKTVLRVIYLAPHSYARGSLLNPHRNEAAKSYQRNPWTLSAVLQVNLRDG